MEYNLHGTAFESSDSEEEEEIKFDMDDRVEEDDKDDRTISEPQPINEETKDSTKIIIVLPLEDFSYFVDKDSLNSKFNLLSIDAEPRKPDLKFRPKFDEFLEVLTKHPRAIIIFKTNKPKDEKIFYLLEDLRNYLEKSKAWTSKEVDNFLIWTENTIVEEKTKKASRLIPGQNLIKDVLEVVREEALKIKNEVEVSENHILFIETKSDIQEAHKDFVLIVPEIQQRNVEEDNLLNKTRISEGIRQGIEVLKNITDRCYSILNAEEVQISQFLKDSPLGEYEEEENAHIKEFKMIQTYPDIDIEVLKSHPEIGWLLKEI